MELLQLHYFRKVARLEHMTKAAQELHIAQPVGARNQNPLHRQKHKCVKLSWAFLIVNNPMCDIRELLCSRIFYCTFSGVMQK